MALFPKSGGTRLVSVRALGGDFPFYGKMETVPATRGARLSARWRGGSGRKSALSIPGASRRSDQDRRGDFHDCRRPDEDAGRSIAGREFRAAGLYSAARPCANEAAQAGQPRALSQFREVRARRRRGGGSEETRAANRASRARIRHGRETEEGSGRSARQSLPISQSGRLHLAPARRGRSGERDSGAPATEDAHRRSPAMSRRSRSHDRRRLSASGDGDGNRRCPRWRRRLV